MVCDNNVSSCLQCEQGFTFNNTDNKCYLDDRASKSPNDVRYGCAQPYFPNM